MPAVTIVADVREKKSGVIDALERRGARVTTEQLATADYLLSDRTGVERKAVGDFLQSIIDKRLFTQAVALKDHCERPFIFIEGRDDEPVFETLYSLRAMNANAIRGAISFLMLEYGIPVLFTKNRDETAEFLYTMARQEQQGRNEPWLRPKRSQDSIADWQQYIVEALPGVGRKNADALLNRFGTVERVMCADKQKLMAVEGFGETKTQKIRDVLTTRYRALDAHNDEDKE